MSFANDENVVLGIAEAVRLWHPDEKRTFKACSSKFARKPGPSSRVWFRKIAAKAFKEQLTESALLHSLESTVPVERRQTEWDSLLLLRDYISRFQWRGDEVSPRDIEVAEAKLKFRVSALGRFSSPVRDKRYLFALQPRLDTPSVEQASLWVSALHYAFCCDPLLSLEPLLLDLARPKGHSGRQINEMTFESHPLIEKNEFDARLAQVSSCYLRAKLEQPPKPVRDKMPKPDLHPDLFEDQSSHAA